MHVLCITRNIYICVSGISTFSWVCLPSGARSRIACPTYENKRARGCHNCLKGKSKSDAQMKTQKGSYL